MNLRGSLYLAAQSFSNRNFPRLDRNINLGAEIIRKTTVQYQPTNNRTDHHTHHVSHITLLIIEDRIGGRMQTARAGT
jgi:hypothetical protein